MSSLAYMDTNDHLHRHMHNIPYTKSDTIMQKWIMQILFNTDLNFMIIVKQDFFVWTRLC